MRSPGAEWRFELPASLEAIEEICIRFQEWRKLHCEGLQSFPSELLLREALTNSVVHGASEDPGQRISCVLRAGRGRLLIAVQDGGEGFDWRSAFNRKSDLSDTHGRGIEILKQYANSVRFNRKGNSVTLVKRF
jgi:serine/threonine-protein kinase RsbW